MREGAVAASSSTSLSPVIDGPIPPAEWKLGPNYPNPFN
jgi:hypothetical protein